MATAAVNLPGEVQQFLADGTKQLLIGGEWRSAVAGGVLESIDPATEDVLVAFARGEEADVDHAVAAAREAFEDARWSALAPERRATVMHRLATLLEENREELEVLESLDSGKPLSAARSDIGFVIACFRYYAGAPERLGGRLLPTDTAHHGYIRREPVGVCGQIIPWNFPLTVTAWKVAPGLACGNALVVKPAEQTPLSALRLGELALEAGVPPGILNVVTGDGIAGAALAAHPDVDKVSFTGSTAVGREVMAAGARTLKRVTLELGGKSPNIVLADADLSAAVPGAVQAIFSNSGQMCSAGSRLLVDARIQEEFLESLASAIEPLRIGHGLDPATDIGPLISSEQRDRVRGYIDLAQAEGAETYIGGHSLDRPGYFVPPTIITGVDNGMRIAQEEIFGPVLSVISFADEDEAVALANHTSYGLAAAVWTQNVSRAHRIAARIRAGSVWVNGFNELSPLTPFGGYKQSGIGRELGDAVLDEYLEQKTVIVTV